MTLEVLILELPFARAACANPHSSLALPTMSVTLILLGPCGAGKSALVNSLCAAKVAAVGVGGVTRVCQVYRTVINTVALTIIDTPGCEDHCLPCGPAEFRAQLRGFASMSDRCVVAVVYDKHWKEAMRPATLAAELNAQTIVFVRTKMDLLDASTCATVREQDRSSLLSTHTLFLQVSAKNARWDVVGQQLFDWPQFIAQLGL